MSTLKPATLSILVVSASPVSAAALSGILKRMPSPAKVIHSTTCRQAFGYIRNAQLSAILCEALLPDGSWNDLLAFTEQESLPPALVVTSPNADECLWAEVLNLGGYDVLAQPFNAEEVRRVVQSALRSTSDRLRRRVA